jgi:hypothetical protein
MTLEIGYYNIFFLGFLPMIYVIGIIFGIFYLVGCIMSIVKNNSCTGTLFTYTKTFGKMLMCLSISILITSDITSNYLTVWSLVFTGLATVSYLILTDKFVSAFDIERYENNQKDILSLFTFVILMLLCSFTLMIMFINDYFYQIFFVAI